MKATDLDSPETTICRIGVIESKNFLRHVYENFYKIFKDNSKSLPKGLMVEIGSGAGFLKKIIPEVITTDIMKLPNCDMCFSAEKIPLKDKSVSAYYLLNTFHHIKNPKKALSEFSRTLKVGGKVIMIEPYNSLWGRFIYKNFHHETFDPEGGWLVGNKGDLSSANGAIPWIIFNRDKKEFERIFPELKILKFDPHTPVSYLISGGFTLPSLLPDSLYPSVKYIESKLTFIKKYTGMFATVVLQKK